MGLFDNTARNGSGRPFDKSLSGVYDRLTGLFAPTFGTGSVIFVDNSKGSGGNGESPDTAFNTITLAVAAAIAGDTIIIQATGTDYDESVTCTTDRITFLGIGMGNEVSGWTADTDATCLTLSGAAGARVSGIFFRADGATSGCAIDISESASNSNDSITIDRCLFKGTGTDPKNHILANGSPAYVKIYNNHFTWCDTAINCTSAAYAVATGWEIVNNYFADKCANYGIYVPLRRSLIKDNHFSTITVACSTIGYAAIGSFNDVNGNYFQSDGTWNTIGEANADDNWQGNFNNFAFNAAEPA